MIPVTTAERRKRYSDTVSSMNLAGYWISAWKTGWTFIP